MDDCWLFIIKNLRFKQTTNEKVKNRPIREQKEECERKEETTFDFKNKNTNIERKQYMFKQRLPKHYRQIDIKQVA